MENENPLFSQENMGKLSVNLGPKGLRKLNLFPRKLSTSIIRNPHYGGGIAESFCEEFLYLPQSTTCIAELEKRKVIL